MSALQPHKIEPGATVPSRELPTVTGGTVTVPVPEAGRLTHLQFRRFAGCPVCNLHLRSMAKRHHEITAAGIHQVVVFHSSAEGLLPYVTDLPFTVVPDPDKGLYVEFGVESSPRSLLNPRAWWPIVRAVAHSAARVIARRGKLPPTRPEGGRLGLPADLLLTPDGQVIAAHYGHHANDQWSVDTLLHHAATQPLGAIR